MEKDEIRLSEQKAEINILVSNKMEAFIHLLNENKALAVFDKNFEQSIMDYWDSIKEDPNRQELQREMFELFTMYWNVCLANKDYVTGVEFWKLIYKRAYNWDKNNIGNELNKGSLYYFFAASLLANSDYEKAFIVMNEALKEDIRLSDGKIPDTPAFLFITIDSSKNSNLIQYIIELETYLNQDIYNFNISTNSNLSFNNVKSKFTQNYIFLDEVSLFTFLIVKYHNLSTIYLSNFHNRFTTITYISMIFDLTVIIENVLLKTKKSLFDDLKGESETLPHLVLKLLGNSKQLQLNEVDYKKINTQRQNKDKSKVFKTILNNKYRRNIDNMSLNEVEKGFAILYAIRNHRAHSVQSIENMTINHELIFKYTMQTLFFVIDNLNLAFDNNILSLVNPVKNTTSSNPSNQISNSINL